MRRHVLQVAGVAVAAALVLTACGGSDADGAASDTTATADAAFPRTVVHAMGETEIPARPSGSSSSTPGSSTRHCPSASPRSAR